MPAARSHLRLATRSWLNGEEVAPIAAEVLDAFRALLIMLDSAPQLAGIEAEQMCMAFIEERSDELVLVLDVEALADAGTRLVGGAD